MKIGILGTGVVGKALATGFVGKGHEVIMGSRTPDNEEATAWAAEAGPNALHGTFSDAAKAADVIFNCTSGKHSLEALNSAGAANLSGKVVVDVANPLNWDSGALALDVCNTDSLGEQIQRTFPDAKVVKGLNTLSSDLMTNPRDLPAQTNLFVCGDDDVAKKQFIDLITPFGWTPESILDLGPITSARGMEAYLLLWAQLYAKFGSAHLNIAVYK